MSTKAKAKPRRKPAAAADTRSEANHQEIAQHARSMCSSLEEVEANARAITEMLGEVFAERHAGTGGEDELDHRLHAINLVAWRIRWNLGFLPEEVSP